MAAKGFYFRSIKHLRLAEIVSDIFNPFSENIDQNKAVFTAKMEGLSLA